MIKVTVIALGKLKEKYLRDAVEEYTKRLSRYCKLEIFEIEPERLSEKPSGSEISAALSCEKEKILKKIPQNSTVVSLCIEGKEKSSEEFAAVVEEQVDAGKNLTLIIGSSYGLSDEVKKASDIRLSLSKMTFPHQLFRVMLLEQLYRAFKINEGSQYHK
ncbi:MAG: 23S rRNA (pseudouridine(1915)-N(3))-methyltransferase RlmH [Ruminococcaceae bacterium]|nr:23S rRNA (pseudouridine(1915)-N(3))-methyltransferase RlmH [Oscillospiraceae bacterium]